MAYAQTAKGAHQAWAYAVNDQSYTYENMLQYYKKTLNYTMQPHATRLENATVEYNPADMSTGGELQVTYPAYTQSWSTWVSKGLAAIGVPEVGAFINGNLLGHTWQLSTIRASDSHRSDSDTAYLRPVMSRPNLSVFQFTMAERIIFENKIAKGVAFTSTAMGCIGTALASKEVILSAGVFQSPQLLQVSGVGPKDLLEKNGIKVVADVPGVGQGMRDHMTIFASYEVDVLTSTALSNAEYLNDAIKEFNENASGPLSSPGGDLVGGEKIPAQLRKGFAAETKECKYLSFYALCKLFPLIQNHPRLTHITDLSSYPDDWPEILFNVFPGGVSAANGASGKNFATLQATLVAPHSRGTVTIQSSEMSDAPIINPNWLTENSDIDVLVAGFKRVREVLNSSAMAPVLKGGEVFPGPSVETDEDIRAYIARSSSPLYHAFATNRMGNGSDPNAVVDSRGRVVGVSRRKSTFLLLRIHALHVCKNPNQRTVRVIDSSSFPFLPPGPAPQIQVCKCARFQSILYSRSSTNGKRQIPWQRSLLMISRILSTEIKQIDCILRTSNVHGGPIISSQIAHSRPMHGSAKFTG